MLATHRATCTRESTPSLLKMLATWLSTVRSPMKSWAAVCAFGRAVGHEPRDLHLAG